MDEFEYMFEEFRPEEVAVWNPEENKMSYVEWKKRLANQETEWRKRIDEGGHVMLAEFLKAFNLPHNAFPYDSNLYGWDKKGFRQLFRWKTELEKLD